MGSTSRWVAYLRSHFNGKSRTFLPQMEKVRCFESSIRVSGVSMNKIQCSKRESLSSHPKPKFLPSANFLFFLMCVDVLCFSSTPQKNAKYLIPRHLSCCIHQDSGGVVVKDTESRARRARWKNTTTTSTTSFSKKKRMAFCVEFEVRKLVILDLVQRIWEVSIRFALLFGKNSAFCSHSLGGGEKIQCLGKCLASTSWSKTRSIFRVSFVVFFTFILPKKVHPKSRDLAFRKQWISGRFLQFFNQDFFVGNPKGPTPCPTRNKAMIPSW